MWTAVLYTNSLSLLPTLIIGASDGEIATVANITWTSSGNPEKLLLLLLLLWRDRARAPCAAQPPPRAGASLLLLSCLIGLGISWSGFM